MCLVIGGQTRERVVAEGLMAERVVLMMQRSRRGAVSAGCWAAINVSCSISWPTKTTDWTLINWTITRWVKIAFSISLSRSPQSIS